MGLAPRVVERIFGFVGRLAGQGAALLLVEQYVTRALELADVVYLLNKGEITFRGSARELSSEDVFAEYVGTGGGGARMSDLLPFIVLGLVERLDLRACRNRARPDVQDLRDHESRPRRARGCGGVRLLLAEQDHGLPWPAALLLSVVVFGALLGLALERFARLATRMPAALQISGTVGIILVVQGLVWEWKGRDYILFDQFLPRGTFTVLGAYVSWDQVIIIVVGLAVTLALFVFLRRTRLGFAMRGVVDDPDLLSLSGTSPSAVRRWGWVIGLLLACLSGVLLAPSTSLDAAVLTQLVVQAFGAAAIGAFSSLPLTYVGGLGIGLASAISTKYIDAESPLQGLPPSIPFIVLFVALIVTRRDKLVQRLVVPLRPQAPWQTPLAGRLAFGAAALAFLALVPRFAGVYMASWMLGVAYIVLFLSLGILVKTSNQVSLAHATFAAIGASTFAHFQSWVPWGVALLLTGLVLVPIGAAVAIPAIRVSGVTSRSPRSASGSSSSTSSSRPTSCSARTRAQRRSTGRTGSRTTRASTTSCSGSRSASRS